MVTFVPAARCHKRLLPAGPACAPSGGVFPAEPCEPPAKPLRWKPNRNVNADVTPPPTPPQARAGGDAPRYMRLDGAALENLELLENSSGGTAGEGPAALVAPPAPNACPGV